LGYIDEEFEEIIKYNVSVSAYNYEQVVNFNNVGSKLGKPIKIHIKVDTGMNRLGFKPEEVLNLIKEIENMPFLEIEGIYSHFYDENNIKIVQRQYYLMKNLIDEIKEAGIKIPLIHMSKSQPTLEFPEAEFDMVRVGGLLYGLTKIKAGFQSVATFKAKVGNIKVVEKGETVGYDSAFMAKRKMKIAIITAGYADGFRSVTSNRGFVLLKDKKCRVLGRICMNQAMVDASDLDDVKEGDEVVLLGRQGENEITNQEAAMESGSVLYETIARVPEGVPRIWI
jgi:alanine racemase